MYNLLLKNRITNSAVLVVLLLAFAILQYIQTDMPYAGPSGWLYQEWFGNKVIQAGWIWAFLLLTAQLYVLLDFCLRYKISSEASLIPGLIFVLFTCLIPAFYHFQPILFANTFLLFSLWELFGISPRQSSSKKIFNSGMWLCIAYLFYASYVWFIIALISGINILRSWRYNDLKILFLGFLSPLFLLGVYYFWFDRFHEFKASIWGFFGFFSLLEEMDYFNLGISIFILISVLTVVLFNARVMTKKTILKQNYFKIIYWALFCCFLQVLFQHDQGVEHLLILTIPIALLFSEYLINLKHSIASAVSNLLLIIVVVLQLKDILLSQV